MVLGKLPGGEHWVRLLFFDLFLLGIDSAFALIEAVTTVVLDTKMFQHTAKWRVTLAVCIVAFFLSLMYATDAGLIFLDVIDFYINVSASSLASAYCVLNTSQLCLVSVCHAPGRLL